MNKNKPKINEEVFSNGEKIIKTFNDFGVKMKMENVQPGPIETLYSLKMITPIRIKEIEGFQSDLAYALGTEKIQIETPLRNQPLIGIRVENKKREFVSWKEIIKNKDFRENKERLLLPIGRTVGNEDIFIDFFESPHLMVGGSVCSGKSTFLVSLIASLMTKFNSDELKLVLADPKRVEFTIFSGSPYILRDEIYSAKDALSAFEYLVDEMERRFELLQEEGTRDLLEYNKKAKSKLPYIFFIADEIADFMVSGERGVKKSIEKNIVSLAQKSRAIGIYIILCTQRICAETVSGMILANISTRIGFKVATSADSRWLLDYSGAEKLLGDGDGLLSYPEEVYPKRIQAPLITTKEATDIIKKSK